MRHALTALLVVLICASAPAKAAERRVALVVGNGAYAETAALPNPPNDARAMAEALRGIGFEVVEAIDVDHPAMLAALAGFAERLEGAGVGLFFYAGHGLQVAGENYLVPVDARLNREAQVKLQTVPLQTVLDTMEAEVPTRLVILDACRDNPLARSLARSVGATRSTAVGQGLAGVQAGVGTLVAYSTAPGAVALDGRGSNSPFTAALLEHIGTSGLEVRQVLGRVRGSVYQATGGRQVPWDSSSLLGELYLRPPEPTAAAPGPPPAPPPAPPRQAADGYGGQDRVIFDAIRGSARAGDYAAFLERFPGSPLAFLVEARLEEMLGEAKGRVVAALPPAPGRPRRFRRLRPSSPWPSAARTGAGCRRRSPRSASTPAARTAGRGGARAGPSPRGRRAGGRSRRATSAGRSAT